MSTYKSCLILLGVFLATFSLSHAFAQSNGIPVYVDSDSNYQSVMLRQQNGQLLLVFEKFNLDSFSGDLYATLSANDGYSWSTPFPIIDSSSNERHPSLVKLGPGNLALFYHKGDAFSNFRIYRATSEDGVTWTEQGAINLGWNNTGEVNPSVILEEDGSLTMTYNRMGEPSYIARSTDGGVTWDHNHTQVSDGPAALARLTKRDSDGLYLVTYEVGTSNMQIFGKTSLDPYDWSGAETLVSGGGTNQDSRPLALEGGAFMVAYAHQPNTNTPFSVYYRISPDGLSWSDRVRITSVEELYKLEPFIMRQGMAGHVKVIWSQQKGGFPYIAHDIWIMPDLTLDGDLGSSSIMTSASYVRSGDSLTYTLTLSNSGAFPLAVNLVDEMPAHTTYQPGTLTADGGIYSFDPLADAIDWTVTVDNAAQAVLSFAVLTASDLQDGDLITNVAHFDDNLGVSHETSITTTVDALPPNSSFISPVNGQLITSGQVLLVGTASDARSGVVKVEVKVDEGPWQTVSGLENWSLLVSGLAEGSHKFQVRGTDAVGHVELSPDIIYVQIDTVPPFGNVELFLPAIAHP
ncbi:MAG: hypothetical protein Fur0021_09960 [Candidatus Promineifilaceae bacterium]